MTTHNHPSESLNAAVSAAGIPSANHDFIRMVTDAVGIDRYRYVDQADKPYVIATRRDGLRDLHIYYVATNGLYSEVEVIRIAGDGAAGPAARGMEPGAWSIRLTRACLLAPVTLLKAAENDRDGRDRVPPAPTSTKE